MIRVLPILFATVLLASVAKGQEKVKLTQYFQAPQIFNPAFTGVEDFLDVKVGRKQNFGSFDFAPKTTFLSISGALKGADIYDSRLHSLRISTPDLYDQLDRGTGPKIRHGLGGYILTESQGAFSQQRITFSYAAHLTLGENLKLTFAVAPSYFKNTLDADKITLETKNDPVYEYYRSNSFFNSSFNLNAGTLLRAQKFYIGYSALQAYSKSLTVKKSSDDQPDPKAGIIHTLMGGYNFSLGENLEFIPGLMVNYRTSYPVVYNINAKVKYKERFWGGLAYQSSGSLGLIAGLNLNERISFSYCYDYTVKGMSNYMSGSHEFVLGFMLFKSEFSKPTMW